METTTTGTTSTSMWFANTLIPKYVTRQAKKEMINIHSQKYLKAWLDKDQYQEKLVSLKKEWDEIAVDVKERVENFVGERKKNPEGAIIPPEELQKAVNIKIGLDTVEDSYKHSCAEFDFFMMIIEKLQNI